MRVHFPRRVIPTESRWDEWRDLAVLPFLLTSAVQRSLFIIRLFRIFLDIPHPLLPQSTRCEHGQAAEVYPPVVGPRVGRSLPACGGEGSGPPLTRRSWVSPGSGPGIAGIGTRTMKRDADAIVSEINNLWKTFVNCRALPLRIRGDYRGNLHSDGPLLLA